MGLNALTNSVIYDYVTKASPTFSSLTAGQTYTEFANAIKSGMSGEQFRTMKNEFLNTTLPFFLNEVIAPDAKDYLEDQDFGVKYNMPYAAAMQNMYVKTSKPINPQFKNIQNGKGADPFIVQKPVVAEIFYTFNFDYQNVISVTDIQFRTAFESATGVAMLMAGVLKSLASTWVEQKLLLKGEAINAAINDPSIPLKESQKYSIDISDEYTREELVEFVAAVNNLVDAMTLKATAAFNRVDWKDVQKKEDLRILYRPSLKNAIKTGLLESAFNKEELNMDIKPVLVSDFGGLVPTTDGTLETTLSPVYDDLGRLIGYSDNVVGNPLIEEDKVTWYDPNEDVLAIICDKNTIVEIDQTAYEVYGIYNPANMVTTYWANKPNGAVHYDQYRNFIVIRRGEA